MSYLRRHLVAVATFACVLLGAVGLAVAQVGGSDDSEDAGAAPVAVAELRSIAAASRGVPGEKPPACPPAELEDQLKQSGMSFGPCVPIPPDFTAEQRAELLSQYPPIPEEAPPSAEQEGELDCPELAVSAARSTFNARIHKQFPCGPGAEILDEGDLEIRGGSVCIPVIWKPSADAAPREELVCAQGTVP